MPGIGARFPVLFQPSGGPRAVGKNLTNRGPAVVRYGGSTLTNDPPGGAEGELTVGQSLTITGPKYFIAALGGQGQALLDDEDVADPQAAQSGSVQPAVLTVDTAGAAPVNSLVTYVNATYSLTEFGQNPIKGTMRIRGRGNFTWEAAKKPYRLSFDSAIQPLGLTAKQKSWALLANYYDDSKVHTTFAMELSRRMGMRWTPQSAPVEVILNGVYLGLYQWSDLVKMETGRLELPVATVPTAVWDASVAVNGAFAANANGYGVYPGSPNVLTRNADGNLAAGSLNLAATFVTFSEISVYPTDTGTVRQNVVAGKHYRLSFSIKVPTAAFSGAVRVIGLATCHTAGGADLNNIQILDTAVDVGGATFTTLDCAISAEEILQRNPTAGKVGFSIVVSAPGASSGTATVRIDDIAFQVGVVTASLASTGTYLMEIDKRAEGAADPSFQTASQGITVAYDDPVPDAAQAAYIRNFVQTFEATLYAGTWLDPTLGYAKYIDMQSFVDWFLINELCRNKDSEFYSSCKLYKTRDVTGTPGRLFMGPLWDFDISLGKPDFVDGNPETWLTRTAPWITRMYSDPAFRALINTRWPVLMAAVSAIGPGQFIDAQAYAIEPAHVRDRQKWANTTYEPQETAYIKNWLSKRIAWLTTQFATP